MAFAASSGSIANAVKFDISNYGVDLSGAAATEENDAKIQQWWDDIQATWGAVGIIPYGFTRTNVLLSGHSPFGLIGGAGPQLSGIMSERYDTKLIDWEWNGVNSSVDEYPPPVLKDIRLDSNKNALSIEDSFVVRIRGNTLATTYQTGYMAHLVIENCHVRGQAEKTLNIQGQWRIRVVGNYVAGGKKCISYDNAKNPDAGDSVIRDNSTSAAGGTGTANICVANSSIMRITGNKCWSGAEYGILVDNRTSVTPYTDFGSAISTQIMIEHNQIEFQAGGAEGDGAGIGVLVDTSLSGTNGLKGLQIRDNDIDNVKRCMDIQSLNGGVIEKVMITGNTGESCGGIRLVGQMSKVVVAHNLIDHNGQGNDASIECASPTDITTRVFANNLWIGFSGDPDILDGE